MLLDGVTAPVATAQTASDDADGAGNAPSAAERYEARVSDEPIERDVTPLDETPVVDSEQDERYRGATPPGYDWPTHGGYLGCLLGVMTGCLLAPLGYIVFGFLGALLAAPLGGVGIALGVILTVALYLAVFVALSRLGWYMGKRFLREYEQPSRPVWGEDDDEAAPPIVEADPTVAADQPPTSEPTASQRESAN